ncbi:sensor histidine kinase [Hymenobacter negativus]|uniref:Sensor histidine kinase n=1 Tax=Hymenobacter negativus TaxID=2795026 RepID=A0ABS3QGI6_9BACT|nr:sensor histidine kinase [Hymenobacter negativus]MBO2009909.1 sensor histidine kinase [Hymenobacter negativus]
MQPAPPADRPSRFPLIFEILAWGLYVGLYKYSTYMSVAAEQYRPDGRFNFPYPQLMLFALLATLYVLPYYRLLVPRLLHRRRYVLLLVASVLYLWWGIKLNTWLAAALFAPLASPPVLAGFYQHFLIGWHQVLQVAQPHIQLLFTDALVFGCVAFAQFAFANEQRRRLLERDHLALQLEQLKSQLQPHFLFNTLNSIYGLSLAGSPETPRFILLLSELMRYVLYDSGREYIALPEEVTFLENYFEMEQRKYAGARITFSATGAAGAALQVPPLLLLPLVENSFKHGRHHYSDDASVTATLHTTPGQLHFTIENDLLPEAPAATPRRSGGIGLVNIRQRLNLYYPNAHELVLSEQNGRYRAELTLQV